MHLDTNLLLTAEVLRLEPGLVRGQKVKETFALKRVASQTYLVVNALQAGVLDEFATGKNVPDALERCIRSRSSPPLREFYDLILKAHRAGVLRSEELCAEGPAPVLRPPVRWFVSLPPVVVLTAAVIGAIATLTVFGLRPPVAPATLRDLLIGWAAVCSALSLGQILAACTLRGAGVEVHRPHVHWLTLVPHFAVDLRESCMAGRAGRAAVPAAAVLPLILTAGAGLWLHAAWSFAPLVGVALAFLPVGHTTAAQLLLLCRRQPLLDTDTSPLFDANLTLVEQARVAWQQFDGRVAALQWVAGLTWALAANRVAFGLLHFDPWPSLPSWSEGKNDLLRLGLALGVLLVIWTLRKLEHRVIDAAMLAWRQWRTAWIRWRGRQTTNDLDAVEQLVRRNPLLRRLDPDTQLELAQALKPFVAGPWRRLFAFDEEPPFVGLVLSGRATLYRRRESGRKERFITVAEGDLFGASHLIEPRDGPVELRTATPFVALTISSDDFRRLVIAPLGAAAVSRYLQHHLFLQRSCALCADWRPAAIARFAELAAATSHPGGGKIIQQGAEVSNLYVLYEGRAQAVRDRKPIGRLNPGDCFGEISLLQASAATADIESKDNGRCLVVNRVEFIRFLSRNHHVALQLERLCSKRLGRPIFPLDGHSFDER